MRPKNCILLGSSGTHSVCVCKYHENVKLMISALKSSSELLSHYRNCISEIICESPTDECHLLNCKNCPGLDKFKTLARSILAETYEDDENIMYSEWTNTDRSSLETLLKTPEEFVDHLCNKLKVLIPHSFITKKQFDFISEKKESLSEGEVLIHLDFSENYSFVVQNAVQEFHWNNDQATIHPFLAYFKRNGILEHLTFFIISDCLKHDTEAVHVFIGKFIEFLKQEVPTVSKTIYLSDGAPSQYKNRYNFANIAEHKTDFGIPCEWHFYSTSQGKGAHDGIGGTLKRMAATESLSRVNQDQILSPKDLYNFAVSTQTKMTFCYVENSEYLIAKEKLKNRRDNCKAIPGISKLHSVILPENGRYTIKLFLFIYYHFFFLTNTSIIP